MTMSCTAVQTVSSPDIEKYQAAEETPIRQCKTLQGTLVADQSECSAVRGEGMTHGGGSTGSSQGRTRRERSRLPAFCQFSGGLVHLPRDHTRSCIVYNISYCPDTSIHHASAFITSHALFLVHTLVPARVVARHVSPHHTPERRHILPADLLTHTQRRRCQYD